ncbi:hypothetical protein PspLS_10793 [Pyricularia sp. CBS 133598]|nr:hypothetical protein PspLS_10793 [Pyricularia sp. CBS 133598]
MFPIILSITAVATFLFCMLLKVVELATQHPDEPELISRGIPFLTTALDLILKNKGLHPQLRDKYNLPIYTLPLPGVRLYIVNFRPLISAVQAQFRTLSFCPLEAMFLRNIIGINDSTNAIIRRDLNSDGGYFMQFPKYIHDAVFPGPGLDSLNKRAIQVIAESLERLTLSPNAARKVKLFEWARHEILMATTEAVYGPRNPFREPKMEKAWYTFEPKMTIFALNLCPRLVASKAFHAREYMVKVWDQYFDKAWHRDSSELTKARDKLHSDFHISPEENARIEVGGTQTVLSNSIPAALWMIYHVFADSATLQDIRDELLAGAREGPDGVRTIDSDYVTGSCPILLSTFKEMLRLYANNTSTRLVMEDYMLDGKILLKKNSILMVPARVQHTDRSAWGDDVDFFDHRRFVPKTDGRRKSSTVAMRGFGGGKTLCPGRQFATVEIIMFAALAALKFDVRPVSAIWVIPGSEKTPGHNAMKVPDWDFDVVLTPRDPENKWKALYSGQGLIELSVEDMDRSTCEK